MVFPFMLTLALLSLKKPADGCSLLAKSLNLISDLDVIFLAPEGVDLAEVEEEALSYL